VDYWSSGDCAVDFESRENRQIPWICEACGFDDTHWRQNTERSCSEAATVEKIGKSNRVEPGVIRAPT
jgi:hypothetical protein